MTRPPSLNANALLLSQTGFSPLVIPNLPTYGALLHVEYQFGVVSHPNSSTAAAHTSSIATTSNYCLKFAADMKKCSCFLNFDEIRIYSHTQRYEYDRVTLLRSGVADGITAATIFDVWDGPQVLVLAYNSEAPDMTALTSAASHMVTIVLVDVARCLDDDSVTADNTLLNIGLDVILTEMVLVSPLYMKYSIQAETTIRYHLLSAEKKGHLTALLLPTFDSIDTSLLDRDASPAPYPDIRIASNQSTSLFITYTESNVLIKENLTVGLFDDKALQHLLQQYDMVGILNLFVLMHADRLSRCASALSAWRHYFYFRKIVIVTRGVQYCR